MSDVLEIKRGQTEMVWTRRDSEYIGSRILMLELPFWKPEDYRIYGCIVSV